MNVPKLRFKEFNDEWIEDKINALVELNPKNPSLPESFIYIDLESVSNGILLQEKIINKNDAPSRAQRQVKLNDILYQTVRPYQKNNLFIDKLSNLPYIASTGYAIMREKKIYQKFLFNKLHTDIFVNEVLDNCTGTSYPAINSNDLGNIKIYYPTNVKEQVKIGNFLSLLDKKIELQTKKIEDLKLFKKGLLKDEYAKICNENNVSLENIAEIYQPQTISQAECTKDGTFLVFGANGIIGKYNKYNHKEKQITISCRGENSGTINETPPYCWINGNSMVINIDNSEIIDKNYLKYILSAQNLKYLISGSGQPQIVRNVVLKHKIPIISIKEQLQFSNKFILIDNKIILENNKLNKLQQLKKGLMQTMFV